MKKKDKDIFNEYGSFDKVRYGLFFFFMLLLFVIITILNINIGSVNISVSEIFKIIFFKEGIIILSGI